MNNFSLKFELLFIGSLNCFISRKKRVLAPESVHGAIRAVFDTEPTAPGPGRAVPVRRTEYGTCRTELSPCLVP